MKTSTLISLVCTAAIALGLAACSKDSTGGPVVGDVARGKGLYNQATLGPKSSEGCVSCHNYNAAKGKADKAPYTEGTGTRAESRVPGMSAEEYVHESIVKPDAYVVEGFKPGAMYQKWAEDLTPQQIADLVAYILSEKAPS